VELLVEGDFDIKLHPFLLGHVQPTIAVAEEDVGEVTTIRGCYDIVMNGGNNITWLMNGFEKFGYRFIGQSSFVLESGSTTVKLCVTMHKEVEKGGRK